MTRYVVRRVALSVLTLLLLATIVFLIVFVVGLLLSWRWTRRSLSRLELDLRDLESMDPV